MRTAGLEVSAEGNISHRCNFDRCPALLRSETPPRSSAHVQQHYAGLCPRPATAGLCPRPLGALPWKPITALLPKSTSLLAHPHCSNVQLHWCAESEAPMNRHLDSKPQVCP
eukprot:1156372-Pelagomonas_calceolata.AAC.3